MPAEQIVNITIDEVKYSPDPPIIKPGDTVRFVMEDRLDAVIVEFTSGTPFSLSDIPLNGAITALASQTETVISTVSAGTYRFDIVPDTRQPSPHPEPPGSLPGELEVSTDTPPEEEKK